MKALIITTVRELRLGETAAGNESLSQLVDAIATHLQQHPESAGAVLPIMKEMLAAQERCDWLWVADLLEHELPQTL